MAAAALLTLSPQTQAYPLSSEQQARLEAYLPKVMAKLQRKLPAHFVLISDGIGHMMTFDDLRGNVLASMYGHFMHGLEAEFYYTGGIHLVNPVGGNPQKLRQHMGPELILERYTQPGASSLSALQHLTTRVFLNKPDVVMIGLGVEDYLGGGPVESYTHALQSAIAICKDNKAEVILIGPSLVRDGMEPKAWGASRLIADAARKVAADNHVMFLDPGLALALTRSLPSDGTEEDKSRLVSDALGMELFDFGPDRIEHVYLNAKAHERAGRGIFQQFLNGLPTPPYEAAATGVYTESNTIQVNLNFTNKRSDRSKGVITMLNVGKAWACREPYLAFDLAPNASKQFTVTYRRRELPKSVAEEGYFPQRGNDRVLPVSMLVSDLDLSQMVECEAPMGPFSVTWDYSSRVDQDGNFPLKFTISNPSSTPVTGTYELVYAKQRAKGNFYLGAEEAKDFSAGCKLSGDEVRSKSPVKLLVETRTNSFVFEREVEAVRNLTLNQWTPLWRADKYIAGEESPATGRESVKMNAIADQNGLQLVFDLQGLALEEAEKMYSLLVDIGLDARPESEVRTFGFVQPLRYGFNPRDEVGKLLTANGALIPDAAFGNGYYKDCQAVGVPATLTPEGENRQRQLVVRIPRVYLYRHEWKLGSAKSVVGLSAKLTFVRVNRGTGAFGYTPQSTWVLNQPGLDETNAEGLATLELREGTTDRWSVNLY